MRTNRVTDLPLVIYLLTGPVLHGADSWLLGVEYQKQAISYAAQRERAAPAADEDDAINARNEFLQRRGMQLHSDFSVVTEHLLWKSYVSKHSICGPIFSPVTLVQHHHSAVIELYTT